jgi:hypothetical protein
MSNNSILLNTCIDQFRKNNELQRDDSQVFELFAISQITKNLDLSFEEIDKSIVDGGNDGGIDSMIVLIDDKSLESIEDLDDIQFSRKSLVTIIITQSKREKSFKEGAIDKLITSLPELFSLEKSEDALLLRFNNGVVQQGSLAREAWKRNAGAGGKLRIIINYCTLADEIEISKTFQLKVDQLKELASKLFTGAIIQHSNYSSSELLKLYSSHPNTRLALVFKDVPLAPTYGDKGIGYIGTVLLSDYKKFLTDEDGGGIREDLFESNIRHFQGQVDVNKKIQQTVSTKDKDDFWWLNNGITIIAQNPTPFGKTLSMDNVQIVNGLQTSYSIYNYHSGDKADERSVLVKVIINEDKQTIDNIIASTNSQTQVAPALLRGTDEIQRNIEMYFENEGYYYDRRKNYYKNQGKPAAKIFSIQTAAQAIESIIFDSPFSARAKPTSLIKDDTTYKRIFDPNKNYKIYLNCCLISKAVNDHWITIADSTIKGKTVNFKLHLLRVVPSVLLGKADYTSDDLLAINLNDLNGDKLNQAVAILVNAIDGYQTLNPEANLISISKTKGFATHLVESLRTHFNQLTLSSSQ